MSRSFRAPESPYPKLEGWAVEECVEGTRWSIFVEEVGTWDVCCSLVVFEAEFEAWLRPVCWEGCEWAVGSGPDMLARE